MADNEREYDPVIPDRVRELLIQKKQSVAVAESVTAGHLQVAFSMAQNAMEFFLGGITVYNLNQKSRHLQVDPLVALPCNSVSEIVAAQMAKNVAKHFTSDWGIAITGYAAPVPEKNIHQLFACYAIYFRDREMVVQTIAAENDPPSKVRRFYTSHVLNDFLEVLAL